MTRATFWILGKILLDTRARVVYTGGRMKNDVKVLFTSNESNTVIATLSCANTEFAAKIIEECNLNGARNNYFRLSISKN